MYTFLNMCILWNVLINANYAPRIDIEGRGKVWMQDQKIWLQHVDIGGYFKSYEKLYTRIVGDK